MNRLLLILAFAVVFAGCNRTYRSSRMFKAKKDYEYATKTDSMADLEFRIEPNDIIDFRLYTNDGFKLIDLSTMNDVTQFNRQTQNFNYLVEHDGLIKLPMIGRVKLAGMTIKEAEAFLEEKYATYYIDPFAQMQVTNRRVTVFSGDYSNGTVVPMPNRNLTLVEGLALAGGVPRMGKAHTIKVIRGNPKDPDIYLFDLSKIESVEQSAFVLQSNDIVYVEPRISLSSEVLREWAPIIAVTTSVLTLYILIDSLRE